MNDKSHACDCPKDMPTQLCIRYCTGECDGPSDEAATSATSELESELSAGVPSSLAAPQGVTASLHPETVEERLKRFYPEHYVTIITRMNEECGSNRTAELLHSGAVGNELTYLFSWGRTPEGYEFWKALAKREQS